MHLLRRREREPLFKRREMRYTGEEIHPYREDKV